MVLDLMQRPCTVASAGVALGLMQRHLVSNATAALIRCIRLYLMQRPPLSVALEYFIKNVMKVRPDATERLTQRYILHLN